MANDPNDPTTVEGEHQPVSDRVLEVSKKADGTPDQLDGFEVIDPDEEGTAADEDAVPQVSGAAPTAGDTPTTKRRARKTNVEETTTR